jgi:uncharacterized protein YdaU (DUF1376 family)
MSKDPAFLFYTSDFLTGTSFLTNEQIGKYIRLLCHQHQNGHLKEKDMLKICLTYDEDVFEKFEKDLNGLFFNLRLDEEIHKRKAYSESRRNNRKKKEVKEEDMLIISNTYVNHMENENENEIINKKERRKVFKKPTIEDIKNKFPTFNAEHFYNYYESNGWMVGKNKMANWNASVKNWIAKDYNKQTQITPNRPKLATLQDE